MKASVAGRIRNTHLPKAKALLPLFEAVMNSFQAIEEASGAHHHVRIQAHNKLARDMASGKRGRPIESEKTMYDQAAARIGNGVLQS